MSKKNPKIPDLIESDENDNNWLTLNPNENNTNTNSEYMKIISATIELNETEFPRLFDGPEM